MKHDPDIAAPGRKEGGDRMVLFADWDMTHNLPFVVGGGGLPAFIDISISNKG
jgi:hypothetical protein